MTHAEDCDMGEDCTCGAACPYCADTGIAFDPLTGEGSECPACTRKTEPGDHGNGGTSPSA